MNAKTKRLWKKVFIIIINFALLVIVSGENTQAAQLGSHGERVGEIQKKLRDCGFYQGEINGNYDFSTKKALKLFQRKNNIDITGESDCRTLFLLGINSHNPDFCIQTELLARYIRNNSGTSYNSMLTTAYDIHANKNNLTLIQYIIAKDPDFIKSLSGTEPPPECFSAAKKGLSLQTIP